MSMASPIARCPKLRSSQQKRSLTFLAPVPAQDQDGVADVPEVTRQLQEHQALILILADEGPKALHGPASLIK